MVEVVKKTARTSARKTTVKDVADVSEAGSEERKAVVDDLGRSYGTGRRKDASSRVWVKAGKGRMEVNGKELADYFKRPVLQMLVKQPFEATNTLGRIDVFATVVGGGLSGQAGAVRHGIARALDNFDPTLHKALRQGGYLTRDSRMVERKKYGKKKARRSFQFSKR